MREDGQRFSALTAVRTILGLPLEELAGFFEVEGVAVDDRTRKCQRCRGRR